jgi:hypothetical protein
MVGETATKLLILSPRRGQMPNCREECRIAADVVVKSVSEIWMAVEEVQRTLRHSAKNLAAEKNLSIDEGISVWYRGHSSKRFKLLPSLSRFQISPEIESQIHDDYAAFRCGERGWNTLFHMQHYGVPTRLLDWTTDLATALYFAFESGGGDGPVLWILHPGILNSKSRLDPKPTLPASLKLKLRYPDHCYSPNWPERPFAIMPPISNSRIMAQKGMFTVQGSVDAALDDQCPDALARIVFRLLDSEKDLLRRLGPKAFSIFPDEVGMAQNLNREYRLPEKAIESTIRAIWRKKGLLAGTAGCITDKMYVPQDKDHAEFEEWLHTPNRPILLLTAKAAGGKTNFLVKLADERRDGRSDRDDSDWSRPILLLSLGHYLRGTRSLTWRLADLLRKSDADGHSRAIDEHVLDNMIRSGQLILALDGLDELVRNRGEECVRDLAEELAQIISDGARERTKIVVACRNHIAHRLEKRDVLQSLGSVGKLELHELDGKTMVTNLERRHPKAKFSNVEQKLRDVPLLYGVFVRCKEEITREVNTSNLWEVWLEVAGRAARVGEDDQINLTGLRKIAAKMLELRDDYLSENDVPERCLDLLISLTGVGDDDLPIFVREQDGRWRFIHQAVREYVVACDIKHGLHNPDAETVVTSISNLDYESAEAYKHLKEMLGNLDLGSMFDRLDLNKAQDTRGNNFARNYFEALGMLGATSEGERAAAIERALSVLRSEYFSHSVRFNAARCLARLHPSSPPVYCEWASLPDWPDIDSGKLKVAYGYAVRGFHRQKPGLDDRPPETFVSESGFPSGSVSKTLFDVLFQSTQDPFDEGVQFVQVNCSHALIRWFEEDAKAQCLELMRSKLLRPETRANLFLAWCVRIGVPVGLEEALMKLTNANQFRVDLEKLIELLDRQPKHWCGQSA